MWVLFVCVTFGFVSQSCCTVLQFPRLSMFWQGFFIFLRVAWCFVLKNCHCPAVHCQANIKMHCTSSVLVLCLHQPRIRIPEILSRVSHSCYICSRCLWLSPFNCLRAPFPVNPCQVSPDYRKSSLLPRTCYVCVCVQDTETLCAS